MGIFNDNVAAGRTTWNYVYTGRELLPYAQRLYDEFLEKETAARSKMADYMKDMTISNNDTKVTDTKRDVITFGTLKEQCQVFKWEFARNPDKEFDLGLGDVTFFGLANE